MHSLKAKFMLAFGALTVTLFVALGLFLTDAKSRELSADIAESTQSFAEFAVSDVVFAYTQYLEPGNYFPFVREVSSVIRRQSDIESLRIMTFSGELLYDSRTESVEQYRGVTRLLLDQDELMRAQSSKTSLHLSDGRTLYVNRDANGDVVYTNFNEDAVRPLSSRDRIEEIVVPFDNEFAIGFQVSYRSLTESLARSRAQIAFVALMGTLITLLVSYLLSTGITNPLKDLKKGASQIADGDFSARVPVRTKDELGSLAQSFNQMAQDLAKSTEAMLYQERVKKELDLARQMQFELLPEERIELPRLDFAGGLLPATEIGGDSYDYIPMEGGRVLTYLGDVTGHGVPAGLVSAITNAVLYGFRYETNIANIAARLNDVLLEKTITKVFVTMAMTIWDENTGKLSYLNAGHPPLLHFNAQQQSLTELKVPGMALGLVAEQAEHLNAQELQLQANDMVVLYSDGIPEAMNANKEQYGMERLKQIVQSAGRDLYTAEGVKNAILSDVKAFMGDAESTDDITVVVLKHKQA
jgi:serine phosphatase RsbU (regulator of sigma subunit)